MKKKMLLGAVVTATVSMTMSNAVMADNCDDIVNVWKSIYSTVSGKAYTQSPVRTIVNSEQWANAIIESYEDLEDSVTLEIANFNDDEYDLSTLKNYNVAISAKGYVTDTDFSRITYSFDYNPNYRISRAVDEPMLYNRLSVEEKEAYNTLVSCTRKLIENLDSDYDKEVAIHNFILYNFKYGPLDSNNVPQRAHSITGFLEDKEGICEAYANTFYVMGKIAGLDVSIVTGISNNIGHMWNMIKLDGEYYHIDVTSDDPAPDVPNRERYNFFNLDDETLSRTHSWDKTEFPKATGTKYNYYNLNNYIIHSQNELIEFLDNELVKGNTAITFRTEGFYLESPDIIRDYASSKGFFSVNIVGNYGKESTYNVTF